MWNTIAAWQVPISRTSASRFAALDALRGIAALLVVLHHSSEYLMGNPLLASNGGALQNLINTFDLGRVGVICFFLISGFIIPSSFSKSSSRPISEFALKRLFRLYPAYWLSLILAVMTDAWILQRQHDISQILSNATMIQKLLGYDHVQGLYWTLQVELFFYILCAGMYSLGALRTSKKVLATALLMMVVFAITNLVGGKWHLISKFNKELFYAPYLLSIMLCGTLLRIWFEGRSSENRLAAIAGFSAVFLVPVVNFVLSLKGISLIADPQRFLVSHLIGLALFLVSIVYWKSPPALVLKMGLYSYSIYLFHPIVMHVLGSVFGEQWASSVASPSLEIQVFATVVLTCMFSALTYRFLESPSNELAKKISKSKFH